jgi:hypothetical protein
MKLSVSVLGRLPKVTTNILESYRTVSCWHETFWKDNESYQQSSESFWKEI